MGCVVQVIGVLVGTIALVWVAEWWSPSPEPPPNTFKTRLDKDTVMLLVRQVRFAGYRCDSIHGARIALFSSDYILHCNDFRYTYRIVDKGGRWIVLVE